MVSHELPVPRGAGTQLSWGKALPTFGAKLYSAQTQYFHNLCSCSKELQFELAIPLSFLCACGSYGG